MTNEALPLIPARSAMARAHKERGGHVAAVLPIHYPRALLRAFNVLPIEVWGPPQIDAGLGAAHLQAYVCSIVRNALAFLLSGGLEVADLIVVPHACDSLQGLGSILIDFVRPKQAVLPLYLPRGQDETHLRYLTNELRAMYERLSSLTHQAPEEAALMASVQREEAADQLLADLHRQRRDLGVSTFDFYRLVRSREFLPAEAFIKVAQDALRHHEASKATGIPIVLSGIVPEPMSLLNSISEAGGEVVADDLACCGRRLYPPGKSGDPLRRMAESLLGRPPDPTMGSPIATRFKHLLSLVEMGEARGVVFYNIKFCEPESFDMPLLRSGLQDAGVPSLVIEVDLSDPLSHQARTRIEAFLEMIA